MIFDDAGREPFGRALTFGKIAVDGPCRPPIGIARPPGVARRHENRMLGGEDEMPAGDERSAHLGEEPLDILEIVDVEQFTMEGQVDELVMFYRQLMENSHAKSQEDIDNSSTS